MGHWASNNNSQHHLHQKKLEKKSNSKGSLCFEPEEVGEEVRSPRLVDSFQECQKEAILFSQTLHLNIPKLPSPAEFNQIHFLIASLFPPKISNLPRAGRLKYLQRNWKKLIGDPAILEIVERHFIPFPAGNYMFKVNNRNTRTKCEICSKLTIKTPESHHWHSLSKTVKATTARTRSNEKVKWENKASWQEIQEMLTKGAISLAKKSEYHFLNTHF